MGCGAVFSLKIAVAHAADNDTATRRRHVACDAVDVAFNMAVEDCIRNRRRQRRAV
jgi:hypothetical protein